MTLRVVFNFLGDRSFFLNNDRIFLGEGLFETIRVDGGKACFTEFHWQRLQQAANTLEIDFDMSLDDWRNKLAEFIAVSQLQQGGVKTLLSAGVSVRGLAEKGTHPCLSFEAFQYKINSEVVRLVSAPWRRDSNNPIYKLKSVNYLEAIMACRYAKKKGAHDVLFFNFNEHALETSIANFFVIHKGVLITPPLEDGIIPGTTRHYILGLCKQLNIPCSEESIDRSLVAKADALFICNALHGIRSVSALDTLLFESKNLLITTLTKALSSTTIF